MLNIKIRSTILKNWLKSAELPQQYLKTKIEIEKYLKNLSYSILSDNAKEYVKLYPNKYRLQDVIYYRPLYEVLSELGYDCNKVSWDEDYIASYRFTDNFDFRLIDIGFSYTAGFEFPTNPPFLWENDKAAILKLKKILSKEVFDELVKKFLDAEGIIRQFAEALNLLRRILLDEELSLTKLRFLNEKLIQYYVI